MRLLANFKIFLNLKSKQGGLYCGFLNENIKEGEGVYIYMTKEFSKKGGNDRNIIFNPKKNIHGLCKIPHEFWKHLTKKMCKCGIKKSELYPFSFLLKRTFEYPTLKFLFLSK